MNVLAIDTSTDCLSVALTINGQVFSDKQMGLRQHAQLVLPMIEKLFKESKSAMSELDGIAFGCGPGSFTGLRIACSVAKAMAFALDVPLYPVSSLAAIASDVYASGANIDPNTRVLSMIDARMQQLYWAEFTDETTIVGIEQVNDAADITCSTDAPLIIAGVGIEAYLPQLTPALHQHVIKHIEVYPRAVSMIRLVQSGKIQPVSAAQGSPVYIRNQVTQGASHG